MAIEEVGEQGYQNSISELRCGQEFSIEIPDKEADSILSSEPVQNNRFTMISFKLINPQLTRPLIIYWVNRMVSVDTPKMKAHADPFLSSLRCALNV